MNIETYITKLKLRKLSSHPILNKIYNFINIILDKYGYITITNSFYIQLKKIIINIIKTYYSDNIDLLNLIEIHQFKYQLEKTIFYTSLFEALAIEISSLEISDINYAIISKIIFEIYLYGTTFIDLHDYLNFNTQLIQINLNKISILNDYIYSLDYFNNRFSANSYKLLILGHLFSFIDNDKKVIIENICLTFARITLEFTKSELSDDRILEIFFDMYTKMYYVPSTPMFYNSLLKKNMLTSCFILNVEDNIDSIGEFYNKIVKILKYNSGIGVILSKIRAKNRYVMNKYTISNGISYYIDILALFSQQFQNHIKQRSANINITLSIDHPDILDFLDLKLNIHSKNGIPYNNLFQTITIPDEFIYRFLTNQPWYLISPEQHINYKYLYNVVGNDYTNLYNEMINNNNIDKIKINSQDLMTKIINTRIQTGGPFIMFKDIVNKTSPYSDIIHGTNLCTEILQYCNDKKTACCNIMSINLKAFVNNKQFNFTLFKKKIRNIVYILNNIMDNTYYAENTCLNANKAQRPMAIGIQGLANALLEMDISYLDGKEFYRKIMELLYYYSLKSSCKLSENDHLIKDNYDFHFNKFYKYQAEKKEKLINLNLSKLAQKINLHEILPKYTYKWDNLKKLIHTFGLKNSLFIGLMPTSLTSGIYNNSESFEPYLLNIYKKTYTTYDILFYNEYLVNDLYKYNIYNSKNILFKLSEVNGDIHKLDLPIYLKEKLLSKHQTLYDIDINKYTEFHTNIDPYVDQGISFNISIPENNHLIIVKNIIDLWLKGKKTIYYYRTVLNTEPLVFNNNINKQIEKISCTSCQ